MKNKALRTMVLVIAVVFVAGYVSAQRAGDQVERLSDLGVQNQKGGFSKPDQKPADFKSGYQKAVDKVSSGSGGWSVKSPKTSSAKREKSISINYTHPADK